MKLYIFVIAFYFSACSLLEKSEQNEAPLTYSDSTERLFLEIENNDLFKNKKSEKNKTSKTIIQNKENQYKDIDLKKAPVNTVEKNFKSTQIETDQKLSAKNNEQLIEINQHLSIFCMKKHHHKKIDSEKKCQQFTKSLVEYCFKKHQKINSPLTFCIKENLKSMR